MSEPKVPAPIYSIWQALITAHAIAQRALEEVRALVREVQALAQRPGSPGPPGLGIEDLDVLYDNERTFTFRWSRGELLEERHFVVPMNIDRGVFKADTAYQRGDCVTYGGHYWAAQDGAEGKPGEPGSKNWRMAVRRGRDGKDGKDGERGPIGPEGKPGRDGRTF